MLSYYERNKERLLQQSKERYLTIKDNDEFIMKRKEYNDSYYITKRKCTQKQKKYAMLKHKLDNRIIDYPTLPRRVPKDPLTLVFE